MGGLMMAQKPDGAVFVDRGYCSLPPTMKQQLQERVAGSSAPPDAEEQLCWEFLAGSFRMAFPAGHEDGRAGCPEGGQAAGGQGQQQQQLGDDTDTANCLVVPVFVRGVPLPVLVALRDIARWEQLLRERTASTGGAARRDGLETLKMYDISPDAVLARSARRRRRWRHPVIFGRCRSHFR
ncbi:hypothetical protein PLESTM_001007600 [Pleodorina starrii]|nr:hypothetical protein PLESTM_001007600 [Pleodorina starrii]